MPGTELAHALSRESRQSLEQVSLLQSGKHISKTLASPHTGTGLLSTHVRKAPLARPDRAAASQRGMLVVRQDPKNGDHQPQGQTCRAP